MFCPSCGQEQTTEDTRFCSRCGLLLTGVSALIYNGGALPQTLTGEGKKKKFFQKKGFKQGLFVFFLAFLVVPIIAILTVAVNATEPFAVFIAWILLWGGGFLRMAYSLMFEADEPNQEMLEQGNPNVSRSYLGGAKPANALPPQQSIPATGYIPPQQGNWRGTNDLGQPSVTEGTTKLLERDE
jgi:hypothetical protein